MVSNALLLSSNNRYKYGVVQIEIQRPRGFDSCPLYCKPSRRYASFLLICRIQRLYIARLGCNHDLKCTRFSSDLRIGSRSPLLKATKHIQCLHRHGRKFNKKLPNMSHKRPRIAKQCPQSLRGKEYESLSDRLPGKALTVRRGRPIMKQGEL